MQEKDRHLGTLICIIQLSIEKYTDIKIRVAKAHQGKLGAAQLGAQPASTEIV